MRLFHFTIASLVVIATSICAGDAVPLPGNAKGNQLGNVSFVRAFENLPNFTRPVFLCGAGDETNRVFVVEQAGRIFVFENSDEVSETKTFLDIRGKVLSAGNEEGLLGLAFASDFKESGEFYVHHSANNPKRNVLARYKVDPETQLADPASEQVLLEVAQPFANHNGGMIAFGPDGMLYLALGDGGFAGDPMNNAQNLGTMLGKIHRIDVRGGEGYKIPEDNPFASRQNARGEIWAYGLRNAWRFSFDRENGNLWAGDVGQNRLEEIDVITKGGNYGWRIFEGTTSFMNPNRLTAQDGYVPPVVEYGRSEGVSVTGGYVYRGEKVPDLVGHYVYGDFGTGNVWALKYEDSEVKLNEKFATVSTLSSFGEDDAGELYAVSLEGKIYRAVSSASDSASDSGEF
ncbi:MAG: PQQ-dependent sugar dehydrogenase [Planctomycetes bacterium]|nr:PQQ-dependent sugar dehydrogenase [Planctomycetota bacterium]